MLILKSLRWFELAVLIAAGMAVFAAFSLSAPTTAHSVENREAPAAFLLRCRARGYDVEQCRQGFARAKQLSGRDHARALMAKCRLTGRDQRTCQRLITASFSSPNSAKINKVKAYCLRNNIKATECKALMADKLGGGSSKSQMLLARCKSVGLKELECKKRVEKATRGLRR